jgi:hypothetical protein
MKQSWPLQVETDATMWKRGAASREQLSAGSR